MKISERLARRFGNPLEWSAVDQGILIIVLIIPVLLSFVLWCNLALTLTDDGAVFIFSELHRQKGFLWTFILLASLICVLGVYLRKRRPASLFFQHMAVQFFSITMSVLGYRTGSLSMVAGVVITGVPLVFYIFFDRKAVIGGVLSAMMIIFGTSFAAVAGHIPYAPVLAPAQGGGEGSLFWVSSMVFLFVLPQFAWMFAILAYVISRWRQREAQVAQLSIKDPLTGLLNRRAIMEELDRELARSRREGSPLSVVMVDLDHFKHINDQYGHQCGDVALVTAARSLLGSLRQYDRMGRFGGEEFLLLLPNAHCEAANEVAERCRRQLACADIAIGGDDPVHLTGSFGVACPASDEPEMSTRELIHRADMALYDAKRLGRNRVITAKP